jgi:hypothetical protein
VSYFRSLNASAYNDRESVFRAQKKGMRKEILKNKINDSDLEQNEKRIVLLNKLDIDSSYDISE